MSTRLQKKIFALVAMLFTIALGTGATTLKPSQDLEQTHRSTSFFATSSDALYPVRKIVDGDTVDLRIGSKTVKVRLIGLNTPESVDPRRPVECFGKEASAEATRILHGLSVHIETDPSQDKYDKYGRLLAYIFLPDGTNFNEHMIAEGYGYEYTYNRPYKYQHDFKTAEQHARELKKGLWGNGICN